jgi:DNA-directed RNA polymerase subunit RPC12/RpoP
MLPHKKDDPLVCSVCHRQFLTFHERKMHMAVHNEDTSYQCLNCGDKFPQASSLALHMMQHKEDSLRNNQQANSPEEESWPESSSEEINSMTTNTPETNHPEEVPEKPYRCNKCGKHFAKLRNLEIHSMFFPHH